MNKISGLDENIFETMCKALFPSGGITKKDFSDQSKEQQMTNSKEDNRSEDQKLSTSEDQKIYTPEKKDKNTLKKEHKRQIKQEQKNLKKVSQKTDMMNALEKIKSQTRIEKEFSNKDQERIQKIIFNK